MMRRSVLGPAGSGRGDEAGSLIVALAVMLVLTTLSLALLARTASGLLSVRAGQNIANATAAARAGLDDALYALNNQAIGTALPASIPPTTQSAQQGSLPNGATFAWRATFNSPTNSYSLVSTGTANRITHTLAASAGRQARYPFAIWGTHGVTFNGQTSQNGKISSSGGVKAFLGSNGDIVIADGTGGGDGQVPYPPRGGCSGCPSAQPASSGPFILSEPSYTNPTDVAPDAVPATPNGCPGSGLVDGTTSAALLTGGVYLCSGMDLTLKGSVSVNPQPGNPATVIFLTNGASLHLKGLVMGAGNPTQLIIEKAGPGTVDVGGSTDSVSFTGILYAPDASLSSTSCNLNITGALIVDSFTCDGGTSFDLAYPASVQTLTEAWSLANVHDQPTPSSL